MPAPVHAPAPGPELQSDMTSGLEDATVPTPATAQAPGVLSIDAAWDHHMHLPALAELVAMMTSCALICSTKACCATVRDRPLATSSSLLRAPIGLSAFCVLRALIICLHICETHAYFSASLPTLSSCSLPTLSSCSFLPFSTLRSSRWPLPSALVFCLLSQQNCCQLLILQGCCSGKHVCTYTSSSHGSCTCMGLSASPGSHECPDICARQCTNASTS